MHVTYFATVADMSAEDIAYHAYVSVASTQRASEARMEQFEAAFRRRHRGAQVSRQRSSAFTIPTNVLDPAVYRLVKMTTRAVRASRRHT